MTLLAWVFAGAVLAAILAAVLARTRREFTVWAAGLAAAALVYPVFALAGGAGVGVLKEFAGALPWVGAAALANRMGPSGLGVAWALHGVLDMAPLARPWVPVFYPPLCLGFDLVVAARLIWMRHRT